MKKLEQQGFAITTVALIVVAIVLIGGVGYYVGTQGDSTQEESFSQSGETETEEGQTIETQPSEKTEQAFVGDEVNCHDQFTLSIPEAGWYFGHIENGDKCFVATQKEMPAHGRLAGDDIGFIFDAEKVSAELSAWVDEYFNERGSGEFAITRTGQETIELNNGDEAILATSHGGHNVGGNDKSMYFFYKKDSLGIKTSWDVSITDQKLRDTAKDIVRTIN